jgi:hypothetical protein
LNIIQAYLGNPCKNDVDPLLQVKKKYHTSSIPLLYQVLRNVLFLLATS